MTHEEILKAARERIAEIDKATAAMTVERAKLAALLAPASITLVPPNPFQWLPSDIVYPRIDDTWYPPFEPWAAPLPYYMHRGESSDRIDIRIRARSGTGGSASFTLIGDATAIHVPNCRICD